MKDAGRLAVRRLAAADRTQRRGIIDRVELERKLRDAHAKLAEHGLL